MTPKSTPKSIPKPNDTQVNTSTATSDMRVFQLFETRQALACERRALTFHGACAFDIEQDAGPAPLGLLAQHGEVTQNHAIGCLKLLQEGERGVDKAESAPRAHIRPAGKRARQACEL